LLTLDTNIVIASGKTLSFNSGASTSEFSTDGTLSLVATQKAVKTYVDNASSSTSYYVEMQKTQA
jgi:hypothetical protein